MFLVELDQLERGTGPEVLLLGEVVILKHELRNNHISNRQE
jgi:hypothetical protein